jgi:DNA-binding transcriptional LysR family regulator
VKNIESISDPTAGEVRIGSSALLSASFVSGLVDQLSRLYSRLVFRALHRDLIERNVDFLIERIFDPILDERLGFEFLFDETFVVGGLRGSRFDGATY